MVVAVAFSCVSPDPVAVRGIVFCPESKSGLILSRLCATSEEPFYSDPIKKRRTGRHWVEQHFDCVTPSPTRVELPTLSLKRYFAFARVDDVLVREQSLAVGLDVFVGPGEFAFPRHDRNEARLSSRAIHGFAHVTHSTRFNNSISQGQGHTMSGNAALCVVEKMDDLLGNDWRIRRDGTFEVIPKDEVGAMLLVQPPTHGVKRGVCFDADTIISDEVRNPLERGFIFRAGLVIELPEALDRKVVGL
jgi:hypothetical protein